MVFPVQFRSITILGVSDDDFEGSDLILLAIESGGQRVFCDTYVLLDVSFGLSAMQSPN